MGQPNDEAGTDEGSPEDNELIKNLRKELKAAKVEAKELLAFKEEATEQAELARSEAADTLINGGLFPEGLKGDVLSWIEGQITAESVTEALQARGLAPSAQPQPPAAQPEQAPQSASQLGQQVAQAAGGEGTMGVDQRIAAATTVSELNAIMAELGATRDYTAG